MSDVYIANFGRHNIMWQDCLARSTVATVEDENVRLFWLAGDRQGYIEYCIQNMKTVAGLTPTRAVASRWFEIGNVVTNTAGDVWIHTDQDDLWWTISKPEPAQAALVPSRWPGAYSSDLVYEIHKPAEAWSRVTRGGRPLKWTGLHPRAKAFLTTQSTLAALSANNAAYALALINDEPLALWHSRPDWKAKESSAKAPPVWHFSAQERAIWRMVETAYSTVASVDGRTVERTLKVKECGFETRDEFTEYLNALLEAQDYSCALCGLPLQFDGDHDDPQLLASLDRKDSNGHYAPGNLQVVCRFINFWKRDQDNAEFARLLHLVRTG